MKKLMACAAKAAKVTGVCPATKKVNELVVDVNALPKATMQHLAWIGKHTPMRTGMNEQDGEDIRQDAALKVIKARMCFKEGGGASLTTFLNVAADRGARTSLAKRRTKKATMIELSLDIPATFDQTTGENSTEAKIDYVLDETGGGFDLTDQKMDIATVLKRLDPVERKVCKFLMDGKTQKEIPALIGVSTYEFRFKIMPKLTRAFRKFYEG